MQSFPRSHVHPDNFGLKIGAEPVRPINPRTGRLTMPGWFSSEKGTLPSLRTESVLEIDGLAHFEANPDCVLMATQPHQLIYFEPQSDGASIRRVYTPDVAILMVDGSIAVVDFKIAKYAAHAKWTQKEELIRDAYARDHGVIFNVITDQMIKVEPRRTNVNILLAHRRTVCDDQADLRVREAIAYLGLPTTIEAISDNCKLHSPHTYVDRAFSAIINMHLHGEVDLDLSKPLGPATCVRQRFAKGDVGK